MKFFKKAWRQGLASVVVLSLFSACSSQEEISGQIFVVDEDGTSQPLALVDVKFFPREDADKFLARQYREWQEEQVKQAARLEEMNSDLSFQRVMIRELNNDLQGLERRLNEQRERIREKYREEMGPLRRSLERNQGLIENMDSGPVRPSGPVPSAREWERFQEDLERWQEKSRSERAEWRRELLAANEDLENQIEEFEGKRDAEIGEWQGRLDKAQENLEERRQLVAEYEKEIQRIEDSKDSPPTISQVIRRMGEPAFQTQSDANGNFSLALPSRQRFALVARVRRNIRGTDHDHAWVFWIDPREQADQRILLSDRNSLHGQSLGEWKD
ncbi:MAG: hypothetical protein JJT75_03755 [Opitutales bacterium]|nr:hypothetical protein [Opitutales bacterium]MCH8541805.1 hypothetical protein [Opitutales bacterium]